jgi:ankyrin repeat protein
MGSSNEILSLVPLTFKRLLLANHPGCVNMPDNNKEAALWRAVAAGNINTIASLLKQPSINVNHRILVEDSRWEYHHPECEVTPLIQALNGGSGPYEVLSLLIQHPDIDLACVDGYGRNPLMLAVRGERKDNLVSDILERRRLAITPAAAASSGDSPSATARTVSGSFGLNAVDLCGDTALEIAAHENDAESLKVLLLEDAIEIDPPGHEPLLLRATFHEAIEAILAHGAVDVDQVDDLGRSALLNAAARDDRESARVLLRHGARPDLPDSSGFTPIARAATNMHGDMVELLERAIGII